MRSPSTKALITQFGLDLAQAGLIEWLVRDVDDPGRLTAAIQGECPETWAYARSYARSCYNDPLDSAMWRRTLVLHAIDKILGTHGVESLGDGEGPSYAPSYEYLNTGDPYAATLIYKRATDNLYIGSWGNLAERML